MNGRRYHLFDANDEEIDIGLDEIYNGNNSSISLSVFLDKYVRLYYRDKNESKSVYKIYTYSGEYVMCLCFIRDHRQRIQNIWY